MTRLLSFEKKGELYQRGGSLDAVWAEAESLGKVKVDDWFGRGYRATLCFDNGGSHIMAHGEGVKAVDALRAAIDEAVRLGAD